MDWILVDKRLPKRNKLCIVTAKSKAREGLTVTVGSYANCWFLQSVSPNKLIYPSDWEVVAWMYAPKSYECEVEV